MRPYMNVIDAMLAKMVTSISHYPLRLWTYIETCPVLMMMLYTVQGRPII